MEDRETYEISTPLSQRKVVLKSWITGRESQKIDGAMIKGIRATSTGKRQQLTPEITEDAFSAQENAAIECVVVSVDGNDSKVLQLVLDMRKQDYDEVIRQVKRVVDGDLPEKKETSSVTNTTDSSPPTELQPE